MHKVAKFGFSLALFGFLFVWPVAWAVDEFGGREVLLYQPLDDATVEVNLLSFAPPFSASESKVDEAKRIEEMRLEVASTFGSPTDPSGGLTRVVFPNEAHMLEPAAKHPELRDAIGDEVALAIFEKATDELALYDKRASHPIQAQFVWWLAKMLFIGCGVGAVVCWVLARATRPKDPILDAA